MGSARSSSGPKPGSRSGFQAGSGKFRPRSDLFFATIPSLSMRCILRSARVLSFFLMAAVAFGEADSPSPITAGGKAATRPAMVIGFVGGFVKHNNSVHSTVQVAEHLRQRYAAGVYVQAFENRHREQAYREILRRLDLDHDGTLSAEEKHAARIIIFGHSWGASETVMLARKLEREGIPVLLTIQVDSVSKIGQNDAVIPGNVEEAVNFYQPHGLLHGRPEIRAADPSRTQILGNVRLDYKAKPVSCKQYPWFDRVLMKSHIEIECDPKIWAQVESLIQLTLSPDARKTVEQGVKPPGSMGAITFDAYTSAFPPFVPNN
jgi:hypothetical protein